jgi:hypothetical protein
VGHLGAAKLYLMSRVFASLAVPGGKSDGQVRPMKLAEWLTLLGLGAAALLGAFSAVGWPPALQLIRNPVFAIIVSALWAIITYRVWRST